MPPSLIELDFLRVERIGDVVLDELAQAPARDVQVAIVHREIDVGDERRDGLESLEERRQLLGVGGLGRDLDDLLDGPLAVRSVRALLARIAVPQPDRRRQILQRHDDAGEPVGARRVVSRSQLQHHLLLGAEVELLHVAPAAQVPDVQLAAVLPAEQELRVDAVLHHVGRAPRAGDHRVLAQVPPDVVGELLRSAIEFPSAANVEGLRIEDERATGAVAVGRAERAQEDAVRSAVHGVRRGIAGPLRKRFRLDHLHDLWRPRIGLRVENVNARRVDARHDQIPPLHVRMRRVRAEAGAAGVPAEMMEFVPAVRHVGLSDQTAVALRSGVDVQDADRVRALRPSGDDERDVRERLRR